MCRCVNKVFIAAFYEQGYLFFERRGKKLKRVQKAKVSDLELKILFRVLGRYFHVVERHTTVFAMMLDVLLLKVLQHEVGVIIF